MIIFISNMLLIPSWSNKLLIHSLVLLSNLVSLLILGILCNTVAKIYFCASNGSLHRELYLCILVKLFQLNDKSISDKMGTNKDILINISKQKRKLVRLQERVCIFLKMWYHSWGSSVLLIDKLIMKLF